jgi:capsular exopolysaccharide synthesis family protein
MSRIFDALQRSEGERAGSESSALPEGQQLLREAERRVASDWDAVVSVREPEPEILILDNELISPGFVESTRAATEMPVGASLMTAGKRMELINSFQTLPASINSDSRLVSLLDRKSPAAEAVRLLALRLRDFRRSGTLKKVVVTSTIPQEGKSTITANLACTLARRTEERVLLIEGDMRLPVQFRMFGFEQKLGLCGLLRDECTVSESVYYIKEAAVWILPAGISAGNPLELMQSPRLNAVMDQLSSCFDWIIIDSPPVLPLADTSVWMRLADGVLLVTREGVTEKKQLKKGIEALEPQKILGAIINGSKASKYSEYYYGHSA